LTEDYNCPSSDYYATNMAIDILMYGIVCP